MKYIKINTELNLTSGIKVPSGSILLITEGYADIKNQENGMIPAQVATKVFANEQARTDGKEEITGIADFNPTFKFSKLPVEHYETISAESLLINAVALDLATIYGEEYIEIVTV